MDHSDQDKKMIRHKKDINALSFIFLFCPDMFVALQGQQMVNWIPIFLYVITAMLKNLKKLHKHLQQRID